MSNSDSGGSPFGCLGCIATIIVLWALAFGVTYGGVHYDVSCGSSGVEVEESKR